MPKSPGISDTWRAVNLLTRQRGADAEIEAARLADPIFDRGDRPFDKLRRAGRMDADQAGDYRATGAADRTATLSGPVPAHKEFR